MSVRRALTRLEAPDESGAQERSWQAVSAAYRERTRVRHYRSKRRLAVVPALVALVGVLTLTPAGATVTRLISHALGVPHATRALISLPAPGRLLVSGPGGTWTVAADGSRRRVGSWRQASWSPHARYIAVAEGDQLAIVNPRGSTQWTLTRQAVSDPRWYPPTGFRIAYRSGSTLRVVAGDSTGDHLLAASITPVAPAWRPYHPYQLAYAQHDRVIVRDADTGQTIWARHADGVQQLAWSANADRLLILSRARVRILGPSGNTTSTITLTPHAPALNASLSPDGRTLALIRGGTDQGVTVARLNSPRPTLTSVLSGFGVRQVLWSPNGRWLLVSWPAANQWVFIAVAGNPRIAAVSHITQQFDTRSIGGGLPQLEGWCCTARGAAG